MNKDILLKQKTNLTALELRILDYAIAIALDEKNDYCKAEITVETLSKHFGDNTRLIGSSAKRLVEKLSDYSVKKVTDKGSDEIRIFSELSFSGNTITLAPNPSLKAFYRRMAAYLTNQFTSKYAYMLHAILRNKMEEEKVEELDLSISVAELQNKMALVALPKKEEYRSDIFVEVLKQDEAPAYKKFNDFKEKVLEPAVKEINEISELYVTYNLIKTGVPVTGLQFICRRKKASQTNRLLAYYKINYERLLGKAMPELDPKAITKLMEASNNDTNKIFDAYIEWKNTDHKDSLSFMIEKIKS